MEVFSASTVAKAIATALAKTVVESGSKAISNATRAAVSNHKAYEQYVSELLNTVSYFVSYRHKPQHIGVAYVQPFLLDSALSRKFMDIDTYAKIKNTIENSIQAVQDAPLPVQIEIPVNLGWDTLRILTADHLSSSPESAIIISEPGSGKSSLMYYLCYSNLKSIDPLIPIFLDSRTIIGCAVDTLVKETLSRLGLAELNIDDIQSRMCLYIDGLDEVETNDYRQICDDLARIQRKWPALKITVACRSVAYQGELTFMKEYSILPFDDKHVESFIHRWFSGLKKGGPSPELLIADIKNTRMLSDISKQPLLLSLVCNAYLRYLQVARRQTTLFDQCINALLWQWDAERLVKRSSKFASLDIPKILWIHTILAQKLHGYWKKRYIDRTSVISLLREVLPDFGVPAAEGEDVLEELCGHHGIFAKWTEDVFGFWHLALQEYLAGRWYATEKRWEELIKHDRLTDPWWQNVLALCIASLPSANDAMNALRDYKEISESTRLRHLSNILKLDPIVAESIRTRVLNEILSWYHNGTAEQRRLAVDMLIGVDDAWTAPMIKRSLASVLPDKKRAIFMKKY